ncbi:uncharacterized protein [Branchiostoma lanceolatum]|uniref:uncharacterized protein n=1 Tax=Branchiostoma lanceolatum TaxID=7740 RepID=UPI003451B0CE
MKWICLSVVAALCVLPGSVDGAGGRRPKEAERHAVGHAERRANRRHEEHKYDHRDPETHKKLLCDLCPPGTHWVEHCTKHQTTKCQICPDNHYTSVYNKWTECLYCNEFCLKLNQIMVEGCTKTHNSRCECLPGHYLNLEVCSPHKTCPSGKGVERTGTNERNTKCGKCKRGFFSSIRSSKATCQKHQDCSLQNLSIIDRGNRFRDNICAELAEPTHPPVVTGLNVSYHTETSHTGDLLLPSSPAKLGSHPSTFLQPQQKMSKSPDEQLARATTAIQLSSDHLTFEGSALAEVVPEATEEGPCVPTVVPFLAYSDAGNLTANVDQSSRQDGTLEDAPDDVFPQTESSAYYSGESQEEVDADNSSKDSQLPDFADYVITDITEKPTALPSLVDVEVSSDHKAPNQYYENKTFQSGVTELAMQPTKSGQDPPKPGPTDQLDDTDTPALDLAEIHSDRDFDDKDIWTNVAISVVVALLTFSSLTCLFVVVHPVCRGRVFIAAERFCARKTPKTYKPPIYTDKKDDSTTAEDNASVITGSDDTQSVVVDIDDDTDPKAVRPRSLASSTETLQDSFRDAQIYISEHIGTNWRSLSNHLPGKRLTEVQLDCIVEENRLVSDRAMKMLCKWKELNGSKANIERMAKGLEACGQKKIARKVREMGL